MQHYNCKYLFLLSTDKNITNMYIFICVNKKVVIMFVITDMHEGVEKRKRDERDERDKRGMIIDGWIIKK